MCINILPVVGKNGNEIAIVYLLGHRIARMINVHGNVHFLTDYRILLVNIYGGISLQLQFEYICKYVAKIL